MLRAFKAAGFRVIQITGNGGQRRRRITRLKRLVRLGLAVAFCYSETSNLPLFFNEKHRLPVFPFLEYRFFRWLRKQNIPTGLFLRDLHWRFPHFRHYPVYKRLPARVFYWLDWLLYMSRCDRLFVPSAGLADHLPTRLRKSAILVLPPGCRSVYSGAPAPAMECGDGRRGLSLFYVGGVTPPLYNLAPMFECAKRLPLENVVICCRDFEWLKVRSSYLGLLSGNVHIVHAQGEELNSHYQSADLFLFTLGSYDYMNIAMPYKLFEAVSYCIPIVAFSGSEAARWIAQEDAGWVVHDIEELIALIDQLRSTSELIAEKRIQLRSLAEKHSWTNRARSVASALGVEKGAK